MNVFINSKFNVGDHSNLCEHDLYPVLDHGLGLRRINTEIQLIKKKKENILNDNLLF